MKTELMSIPLIMDYLKRKSNMNLQKKKLIHLSNLFIVSKLTKKNNNNQRERTSIKKNEHMILTRPREKESDDENSSEEMQ